MGEKIQTRGEKIIESYFKFFEHFVIYGLILSRPMILHEKKIS